MVPSTHTVGFLPPLSQELLAMVRNRFALGSVTAVLLVLALLATFTTGGPDGFVGMLSFTWLFCPLVAGILVARRVAQPRRTRFVDSLYTVPLRQSTWLAVQAMVGLMIAGLVLLASLPFVLVFTFHVGSAPETWAMLAAGAMVGAFAVALGLLAGVLVGEAGPAAASGLAGAVAVLSFVAMALEAMILDQMPLTTYQENMIRGAHLTPTTLAADASGANVFGYVSHNPWLAGAALAFMTAAMLVAAWFAYTRLHGPLGWQARSGRWLVALLVVAAIGAGPVIASTSYQPVPSTRGFGVSQSGSAMAVLVAPATPIGDAAIKSTFERPPSLVLGQDNRFDVLVLLRVPSNASLRDLAVRVEAGPDNRVTGGLNRARPVADGHAHDVRLEPETRSFATEPGTSPVFRVPVNIVPLRSGALIESQSVLYVNVTFKADGEAHTATGARTILVDVPHAKTQLMLAGAPLPLVCLGLLTVRTIRTR